MADWKLWIDCLASGGHWGYIDGLYARYRRHENNITTTHSQILLHDYFTTLALVEVNYPHLAGACQSARALQFYSMGIAALQRGEELLARIRFIAAMKQRFYWKDYAYYGMTFLSPNLRSSLQAQWASFRQEHKSISTLLSGNAKILFKRN
jgi:hypothetical protein